MAKVGDIVVMHTGQIIVKKKRITYEKVKLSDINPDYKIKLKDKGDKYYSKYKVKDKDGKEKDRTIISVKLKYKDYDGIDKEIPDVRIVTSKTFNSDEEADTFIQEQVLIIERNIRDDRANKLKSDIEESFNIETCDYVITSEEYE